jgi:metal-sulfur cluster biosynthetic enzyme
MDVRQLEPQPIDQLRSSIRARIDEIGDPCSVATGTPMGLVEMGLIKQVDIDPDGAVRVDMRLTSPSCYQLGYFSTEIERRVGALPGVSGVEVTYDRGLDWTPSMMSSEAKERRRQTLARKGMLPILGG